MYAEALELAQSLETAVQNVKELSQPSSQETVQLHNVGTSTKGRTTYFRCGKVGYAAAVCQHKDTVCCSCGKRGHLKRACKSEPRGAGPPRTGQRRRITHIVNKVDGS